MKKPLVLILAAGEGTRLLPLTKDKPKVMINISKEKLVIDYVIEKIPRDLEKAIIIKKEDKFKFLEDRLKENYNSQNLKILYQDVKSDSILPLAWQLYNKSKKRSFLRNHDPLVITDGAIIFEKIDYHDLLNFHSKNNADITLLCKKGDIKGSTCLYLKLEKNRILHVRKAYRKSIKRRKKKVEKEFTHSGVYVVNGDLLNNSFFWLSLGYVTGSIYKKRRGFLYEIESPWIDIGTPETLKKARNIYGKGDKIGNK